jgi:hypothetical protein
LAPPNKELAQTDKHAGQAVVDHNEPSDQMNTVQGNNKEPNRMTPVFKFGVVPLGLILGFGIVMHGNSNTPAPAKPVSSSHHQKLGVVIAGKPSIGGAMGCVNLNETALSTGKTTGRIFDLNNPDECRGIANGTLVVGQKYWQNAACVLPEGASPPCLWVLNSELSVGPTTQPSAAVNQVELDRLTKPNPDWSKIGTRLSEQCVGEIMVGNVSSFCKAEGKAWSGVLNAKLNDPRFLEMMNREYGGR